VNTNDDLSTLLDELTSISVPKPSISKLSKEQTLEEVDINQYVLNKSKALIDAGVDAVQDLKDVVISAQNPDEIESLASLLNATTKAIEVLNKSNLIDKKANKDKELKIMEIEARKEIAQLKPGSTTTNNTNVLIASREEIMKKLFSLTDSKVLEIDDK
jgi:hypothetical protein